MYTKRLVSFMVFEQDGEEKDGISSLEEDASMANLKSNIGDGEDTQKSAQGEDQMQSLSLKQVNPVRPEVSRPTQNLAMNFSRTLS